MTDVLDDADYDNDAAATGGGVVGYAAPVLSWNGNVPASGSVLVTYSVTVHGTASAGDDHMTNTLVSESPASNCAAGTQRAATCRSTTVRSRSRKPAVARSMTR